MLQTTAQLPFSAKFSPPPKKSSTRKREYLRSPEVKAMIRAAKKVGRHGVRDGAIILPIAVAYTASCLVGLKIRNTGHQEYINRLKLEGKNRDRHSYFWTGLYGTTWILSMDLCWRWVENLMRTAINKLPFHLKGLKAMKRIHCIV